MIKRDVVSCVVFGTIALTAGCLCHRYAPGIGLVLMPMFWPLAVLSTRVGFGKAAVTAAVVPFISALLTGMPTMPIVVSVKFAALAAVAGVLWRVLAGLRSR